MVSASLRGRGRSGLLVVTLLCCAGHDHASPPRLPSPPSTPPFLAQAAATGSRHIDMWWKPQNSSTLVSDITSMRHVFSISGVIIYCGLAILDNGTVGYPPALWWGHRVLCPAAIAAAGEAGLNIQIILEGRVTAPCPPPPMPVLARRLIMNGTTCLRCKDGDNCSALSACPVGPPSNPRHSTCCSGHTALCHCSNGGTVECKGVCQCKQSMCPPPPPPAPPPPCNGIELAFQRGGKAVGAEAMRLVQSMDTHRRVTGINIDFEMTRTAKWNPTKAATDGFTSSFAAAIRSAGGLDLTLCVPGFLASPLTHGVVEVFEMAEYSARGGNPHLVNAANWQWKLDFDLAEYENNTSAFVVGLMPVGGVAWENTTESVATKFAIMKQRGIRKVALFCWPGANEIWDGLLFEWQKQLRSFITVDNNDNTGRFAGTPTKTDDTNTTPRHHHRMQGNFIAAGEANGYETMSRTQDAQAASRPPERMSELLTQIHSIKGALAGSTPQVSFVNQPDGSVAFCFQSSPLEAFSQDIYCTTTATSGQNWSAVGKVHSAPVPPNGTKFSAPPSLQWDGTASAGALFAFYPLGIFAAQPAAWNGSQFVWETSHPRQVWAGVNGGGIHGMIRLTKGVHVGRMLTQIQSDTHGIFYLWSDNGVEWHKSTNVAKINGDYEGGCEPSSVELSNGTVLTFIRAMLRPSESVLWQARSTDGGSSFDGGPTPTQLISFQSPVLVLRIDRGEQNSSGTPAPIVLVFNNARPTVGSTAGESYRAILHAAISMDDGATWRGFREVMRDDAIRGSTDENSDHGTAYPEGAATRDGTVIFESGQGAAHWSAMRFSFDWLLETAQSADWTTPTAAWDDVAKFDGSYASGCAARVGDPAKYQGRAIHCPRCTGPEFDANVHRYVFFQPDITSSYVKFFAPNLLPKCQSLCGADYNPCKSDIEITPDHFRRIQLVNWANSSRWHAWSADPTNWFNCSMLKSDGKLPCLQHDGVAQRHPRTQKPLPLPSLALCAAMDPNASSAGFSWNFPSSRQGFVHLQVLLEARGFTGAQIALSDHWEPPWHDRSNPTVSVFVLDIGTSGLPGQQFDTLLDVQLAFDVDSKVGATWSVVGANGQLGPKRPLAMTRGANQSIGAGGINYVTVLATGPGGICVATAHAGSGYKTIKTDDHLDRQQDVTLPRQQPTLEWTPRSDWRNVKSGCGGFNGAKGDGKSDDSYYHTGLYNNGKVG